MSNDGTNQSNIIYVPPRRHIVNYKGLHGWVEYLPSIKKWRWSFKVQFTIPHQGETNSESEAVFEMKKFMEAMALSKNMRSID